MDAPRLVAVSLRRARGTWIRMCPRWFMTGMPATWTSSEPKLRALEAQRLAAHGVR